MCTGIQQYRVYYFQSTECTGFCTSFNTGVPNSSRRDDNKTDVVNMQVRDVTLHTAAVLQNDDLKRMCCRMWETIFVEARALIT